MGGSAKGTERQPPGVTRLRYFAPALRIPANLRATIPGAGVDFFLAIVFRVKQFSSDDPRNGRGQLNQNRSVVRPPSAKDELQRRGRGVSEAGGKVVFSKSSYRSDPPPATVFNSPQ
jgi:hypothetical protein